MLPKKDADRTILILQTQNRLQYSICNSLRLYNVKDRVITKSGVSKDVEGNNSDLISENTLAFGLKD
jgi:hypothetical protein